MWRGRFILILIVYLFTNTLPCQISRKSSFRSKVEHAKQKANQNLNLIGSDGLLHRVVPVGLSWCEEPNYDDTASVLADNCIQKYLYMGDDEFSLCNETSSDALELLAGNQCQLCDEDRTFNVDPTDECPTPSAKIVAALQALPCCNLA